MDKHKDQNFFHLKHSFFILREIFLFKICKFEKILENLKKYKVKNNKRLNEIVIFKKTTKFLDFFSINSCLIRSIIIFKLLKQYGHDPILYIGIKKETDLESHAWIELNGKKLDTSKGFKVMTKIK